jgi:hypothetical protein
MGSLQGGKGGPSPWRRRDFSRCTAAESPTRSGMGGPPGRSRLPLNTPPHLVNTISTVIFEKTHGNETWVCASHLNLLFYNDVRTLKPQVRQKKTAPVLGNMVSPPKCVYCRQHKAKYAKIAKRKARYEKVLAIQQVPLPEHNELVSTLLCISYRSST